MAAQAGHCVASCEFPHTGSFRNSREEELCEYQCSQLERSETSSDDAEKCVQHVHAYQKGKTVQVLSCTAGGWVEGQVVDAVMEGYHTVEFEIPGHGCTLFRKHLLPTSKNLRSLACSTDLAKYDPGTTYVSELDARSALHDFAITFDSPVLPEEMPSIAEALHLEHRGNNAFKAMPKNRGTFSGPFFIAYNPKRCKRDVAHTIDVVLKVHALAENEPDNNVRYKPVGLGFVHTLLHKEGEKVFFNPGISVPFYLGFTVNKNLSTDLRKRMQANRNGDRVYYEGLFERFKKTWDKRGDEQGQTLAENADYLISYTGLDKDENEKLLMELATKPIAGPHNEDQTNARPIKFCTDRSLGFGIHFHQRGGAVDDDEGFTLKLGKHGFAQPLEDQSWWDEYKHAAAGKYDSFRPWPLEDQSWWDEYKRAAAGECDGVWPWPNMNCLVGDASDVINDHDEDDVFAGATKCGILILQLSGNYLRSAACLKEFTQIPMRRIWVLQRSYEENSTMKIVNVADVSAQGRIGKEKGVFPLEVIRQGLGIGGFAFQNRMSFPN